MKGYLTAITILVVLLLSISLPYGVGSPSPTSLVIGNLVTLPSTFFQTSSPWTGASITEIPYLFPYTMGTSAVAIPGICNVPVPVPGTNDASWILNLRSTNYKWSDGVPINSTDLAYSYGVFLPTGPFANQSTYDRWGRERPYGKSITILNSTAIQLNMLGPAPTFLVSWWFYTVYPYHYYKRFTGNNVLQTTAITGGPFNSAYIPNNYVPGSNVMNLVPNPSSPSWNGATPPLDSVTIQFFTNNGAMVSALSAGTIDAAQIAPSDISALSSNPALTITQVDSITFSNLAISPVEYPFSSVAFRRGLMDLVPAAEMNQAIFNGRAAIGNPARLMPQVVPTYWPGPGAPTYNYSIPNAQANFKAAGLTQNSAGAWVYPNGTKVTVNLEVSNNDPDLVRQGQFIQSAMTSAGLNVNLALLDPASVFTDTSSGHYQAVLYLDANFVSPYKWMANAYNTPITWKNSTFTSTLNSALIEVDPAKSLSDIKQAALIIAQNAVIRTILSKPAYVAYNSQKFTGWEPAVSQAQSIQFFTNQFLSETVLTSVRPASSTTMTSSSTGVGGLSNTAIIPAVVIVLVVAAIGVYLLKRRGQHAPP